MLRRAVATRSNTIRSADYECATRVRFALRYARLLQEAHHERLMPDWICSNTMFPIQLIESTEDYLGSATGAGSIASGDKVRWIVIKHTGTSNGTTSTAQSIVLTIDGSTAAYTSASGILLGPGEIIALKPSALESANLKGVVVNTISGVTSSSTSSANKVRIIVSGIVNNIA